MYLAYIPDTQCGYQTEASVLEKIGPTVLPGRQGYYKLCKANKLE